MATVPATAALVCFALSRIQATTGPSIAVAKCSGDILNPDENISGSSQRSTRLWHAAIDSSIMCRFISRLSQAMSNGITRSEEHTSELQSRENVVCRLLLDKKK